jgi:hypothetical protein
MARNSNMDIHLVYTILIVIIIIVIGYIIITPKNHIKPIVLSNPNSNCQNMLDKCQLKLTQCNSNFGNSIEKFSNIMEEFQQIPKTGVNFYMVPRRSKFTSPNTFSEITPILKYTVENQEKNKLKNNMVNYLGNLDSTITSNKYIYLLGGVAATLEENLENDKINYNNQSNDTTLKNLVHGWFYNEIPRYSGHKFSECIGITSGVIKIMTLYDINGNKISPVNKNTNTVRSIVFSFFSTYNLVKKECNKTMTLDELNNNKCWAGKPITIPK